MNSFEINKIITAILVTILVVFGIGKISNIIFDKDDKNIVAYKVEAPEGSSVQAKTSESSLDINSLLAMGSIEHGEKVFKKCKACHRIGTNAKNGTGPHLNHIFGRVAGELKNYKKYSKNIQKLGQEGLIWNEETLTSFLNNPKKYISGTKMNFKGIKKSDELIALIEYLKATTKIN